MRIFRYFLLLIASVFLNCKQTTNGALIKNINGSKIESSNGYKKEQTVCLKKEDSLLIKKFNDRLKIALKNNDKNYVLDNVQIPSYLKERNIQKMSF